jgi:hypothetical protein
VKKWIALLLLCCTAAYGEIGSVTEFSGAAIIKRGKETITVAKGTTVEINDRVETKNGKIKITFKDDTTVNVTESSALVIDDFVYDPKAGAGKLGLKAAAGTVRYVSGNIAHNNPNAVNIKTPTAAIAVRGTDFVMAVDETGKSMVMLMPTCETEQHVNLKGLVCGSGKIDVESGGNIVHMDRPYQATMVETVGTAPTLPIIVNLWNTPIGNNLIIKPPMSLSGQTLHAAAKAAAEKTGDTKAASAEKKDDSKSGDNTPSVAEANSVTDKQQKDQTQKASDEAAAAAHAVKAIISIDSLKAAGINVNDASSGDPNVAGLFRNNNPNLNQIGWVYSTLSPNGHNYAEAILPIDTKVIVIVTQDRVTDAYNFNTNSGKAYGSITITQTYK